MSLALLRSAVSSAQRRPGAGDGVLWAPDLADGVAGINFTVIAGSANMTTPEVAHSQEPSGRVLRNTIPAGEEASGGTKARKWLDTAGVADQDDIYFSCKLWIPANADIAGVGTTTTKQGWGVGGHPRGGNIWEASTGGTKRSDSWTARFCTIPENYGNYKGNTHPFTFILYLYAESADGRTLQTYGIEVPFKKADGSYYQPPREQLIELTGRVKQNSASGVADGIAQAWVGDDLWVDVRDVLWNPTGIQPANMLVHEVFVNSARSNTMSFDYQDLVLRNTAVPVVPPAEIVQPPVVQTTGATSTSLTATLASPATSGNILVGCIAGDKSLGAITAPAGHTALAAYNGVSTSGALVAKQATGGETAHTWTWTTSTYASAVLAELDLGSVNLAGAVTVVAPSPANDTAVASLTANLGAAPSGGWLIAAGGVDSAADVDVANPLGGVDLLGTYQGGISNVANNQGVALGYWRVEAGDARTVTANWNRTDQQWLALTFIPST